MIYQALWPRSAGIIPVNTIGLVKTTAEAAKYYKLKKRKKWKDSAWEGKEYLLCFVNEVSTKLIC